MPLNMPLNVREARLKAVKVSAKFFPLVFGRGEHHYEVVEGGLPADARVVKATMSEDGRDVVLFLESESFPLTPLNAPIPDLDIRFTNLIR